MTQAQMLTHKVISNPCLKGNKTQANSTQWYLQTCQLGVGHHVIYGCRESEHLPTCAFNLDVFVCF